MLALFLTWGPSLIHTESVGPTKWERCDKKSYGTSHVISAI